MPRGAVRGPGAPSPRAPRSLLGAGHAHHRHRPWLLAGRAGRSRGGDPCGVFCRAGLSQLGPGRDEAALVLMTGAGVGQARPWHVLARGSPMALRGAGVAFGIRRKPDVEKPGSSAGRGQLGCPADPVVWGRGASQRAAHGGGWVDGRGGRGRLLTLGWEGSSEAGGLARALFAFAVHLLCAALWQAPHPDLGVLMGEGHPRWDAFALGPWLQPDLHQVRVTATVGSPEPTPCLQWQLAPGRAKQNGAGSSGGRLWADHVGVRIMRPRAPEPATSLRPGFSLCLGPPRVP